MPFDGAAGHHECMSSHHPHVVIWIDHHQAKVVHFDAQASESAVVHSSNPRVHLHHKANANDSGHASVDKKFLQHVAEAISPSAAILVVGPASAKTELHNYLKRAHPAVAARISAVETMDHPTDGQLLAHARRFFEADDRMRAQLRT
jgi:stalled ribosome rescue protein Dom34